jgi:hypothetical protein
LNGGAAGAPVSWSAIRIAEPRRSRSASIWRETDSFSSVGAVSILRSSTVLTPHWQLAFLASSLSIYQWRLGFIYHFNRNELDIDPIWS